jgi:hypothetical protein
MGESTLCPRERSPGIHWTGGYVSLDILGNREISCHYQQSNHYSSSSGLQSIHYNNYVIRTPLIGTGHGKSASHETDSLCKQEKSIHSIRTAKYFVHTVYGQCYRVTVWSRSSVQENYENGQLSKHQTYVNPVTVGPLMKKKSVWQESLTRAWKKKSLWLTKCDLSKLLLT